MNTIPLPQADWAAFPEHSIYIDSGCEFFSSCLSCPLPKCRHEYDGAQVKRLVNEVRILPYLADGLNPREIANKIGLSERTVQRVMARYRSEAA